MRRYESLASGLFFAQILTIDITRLLQRKSLVCSLLTADLSWLIPLFSLLPVVKIKWAALTAFGLEKDFDHLSPNDITNSPAQSR